MKLDTSIRSVPENTLRRLTRYHHFLKNFTTADMQHISCTKIATELNLVPIQVRKDIEMTGISGRPKVGYEVAQLTKAIETVLGWDSIEEAFLVGAGSLGRALLGYHGFSEYGPKIIAAFDHDQSKIGTVINNVSVLDIKKFPSMTRRMQVKIGILTVPTQSAQAVAEMMVESGIKAIWNFSPAQLSLPGDIIVQNENLIASFSIIAKKLAAKMNS